MLSAEAFRAIVSGQRKDAVGTAARGLLSLIEFPYRFAMRLRNQRFDRGQAECHRVNVPVISVGNLTLGGTGKTPLVGWLARWFRDRDVRVSIVSRGYGAATESRNDEAKELEARLPDVPHLQNPDRCAAARVAIEELETHLILLDDGFQHRRLRRDLDFVLIDATEPFGYEHVFPRGMLREPLDGLRRADAVFLTRCNLVNAARRSAIRSRVAAIAPEAKWIEVGHQATELRTASGQSIPPHALADKTIAAFCGIGNPAAFRSTLDEIGCLVKAFRAFPDHHPYSRDDITSLSEWLEGQRDLHSVICTHKDLVKLATDRLGARPLYALIIDVQVREGLSELEEMLQAILAKVEH